VVVYDKFTGRLTRVVVESETLKGLKKAFESTLAEFRAEVKAISSRLDTLDSARAADAVADRELAVTLRSVGKDMERLAKLPEEFAAHEARDEERFDAIRGQIVDLKAVIRTDLASHDRRISTTEAQIARVAPDALARRSRS
jgi:predicted  nucleic acid-binding Zn-ribbon protein